MLQRTVGRLCWKAPGTPPRPEARPADEDDMLHPRRHMPKKNMQRAGLRMSWRVALGVSIFTSLFIILPTHAGPFYVRYIAGNDWLERAERAAKSIWTRRNERDHYLYMTQRKNTLLEILGLKKYNIGGEENDSDEIQKYK